MRSIEGQITDIEASGGAGELDFGRGAKLRVSSLDKIFFPNPGITKGGLMRYYAPLWPSLRLHVEDRPLILKRFPDGVDGPMFFQQSAGEKTPAGPTDIASVSAPFAERELTARLRIASFTPRSISARVMRVGDLWEKALARRPSSSTVRNALRALEHVLEAAPMEGYTPRRASRRSEAGGAGAGTASRSK